MTGRQVVDQGLDVRRGRSSWSLTRHWRAGHPTGSRRRSVHKLVLGSMVVMLLVTTVVWFYGSSAWKEASVMGEEEEEDEQSEERTCQQQLAPPTTREHRTCTREEGTLCNTTGIIRATSDRYS